MLGRTTFFGACMLAVTVAIACGSFEGTDDLGASDAGADGPNGDAGANGDAGVDARCQVIVDESFDDGWLASWALLGKARYDDGGVELVPDESGATGAIWMNVPDPKTGVLHAKFSSTISPPQGDDGLTFGWTSNGDITLGGQGANYGVCGGTANASGLAVAIAGNGDQIRLLDLTNDCTSDGGIDENPFGTNDVEIFARANEVEVIFADRRHVFAAPRAVRAKAIGFTAATGGGHARHAIDSVHVEVCPD